jgi:hypothetical protein
LIPKKTGDRIKTARRDAKPLTQLMRAGDLTPVDGPAVKVKKQHEDLKKVATHS